MVAATWAAMIPRRAKGRGPGHWESPLPLTSPVAPSALLHRCSCRIALEMVQACSQQGSPPLTSPQAGPAEALEGNRLHGPEDREADQSGHTKNI